MLTLVFRSLLPSRFSTRQDLGRRDLLSRAYPSRSQSKENLPAGYGIVVKGTDKIIGSVDFNHRHEDDVLEIGYTLHPDHWGRSYVPEAARALIDLAFKELNLHKIELSCFGYNLQSQRVAEKLALPSKLA